MNQFKTTSLADQVFDKLENDIIQGVYPKGEILTELKLVEQLGVSRTPIREALRRLEQEHLIEDTGKGSRVVGISEEDVRDIMDIREKIEGLAAYYAAVNLTPEGREDAEHQLDIPVESPEEALADRISLEEVLRALPEQDRQLIQLRFYGNRTQSETAKVLHTTQVQISRRERKILVLLRRRLLEE